MKGRSSWMINMWNEPNEWMDDTTHMGISIPISSLSLSVPFSFSHLRREESKELLVEKEELFSGEGGIWRGQGKAILNYRE